MKSQFDKVMEAVCLITNHGRVEFHLAKAIVKVWELYPKDFGLPGFSTKYPDSHKVLSNVYGEKGIVKSGMIEKAGRQDDLQIWTVTTKGLEYSTTRDGTRTRNGVLTGDEKFLMELLRSTVYEYYLNSQGSLITFKDTSEFFKLFQGEFNDQAKYRLDRVEKLLNRLEMMLDERPIIIDKKEIKMDTINILRNASSYVLDKFKNQLRLILKRKNAKVDKTAELPDS